MDNPTYLEPVSDGLLTRASGPWAAEKLDYIRRYIEIFETSMRSKWPQRNYIDLFAGPGKNHVKETNQILLGSPLLSLATKYPFTGYYFSDVNKDNVDTLGKRCAVSSQSHLVHLYSADANKIVSTIVSDIQQNASSSLNLAFLDPEGLELEWFTVAQLGSLRCDLIIHYSQNGISRNIRNAYEQSEVTIIDRFFGTNEWRKIYAPWYAKREKKGMHRELMNHYKDNLRLLGYKEVKQADEFMAEPLIRNKRRNAPLYRLIFASKHTLGDRFWKEVTKHDRYGQKQMF